MLAMQLVCKRTKKYTNQYISKLRMSLPTRGEVMRWIVSRLESNSEFLLVWYMPNHSVIARPFQDTDTPIFLLMHRENDFELKLKLIRSYLTVESTQVTRSTTILLSPTPRSTLECIVPVSGIPNPDAMLEVIRCRGLSFEECSGIVSRFRDEFMHQRVAPFVSNMSLLYERMEGFHEMAQSHAQDVQETCNKLLLPGVNTTNVYWPGFWVSEGYKYVEDPHQNGAKEFHEIIHMWEANRRHNYQHLSRPHNILPDHSAVITWLLARMKQAEPTRIAIYVSIGCVVILEFINGIVVYRTYIIGYRFNSDQFCMTSVPNDCLWENIMKTRRFPGRVDYETLIKVKGEHIESQCVCSHTNFMKELCNPPPLSVQQQPFYPVFVHRAMLLVGFWLNLDDIAMQKQLIGVPLPTSKEQCRAMVHNLMLLIGRHHTAAELADETH